MTGITASGIIYLEDSRLADPELAARQDACRKEILTCGKEEHVENGSLGAVGIDDLEKAVDVPDRVLHANLYFFRDLYVLVFQGRRFRLTDRGLLLADAVHFQDRIEKRWQELCAGNGMSPQVRGHALEEILAESARSEGLNVETRVRSVGEENDLVISRDHDHFLVSCKWEKKRAANHYLESLRMRLLKRPGTLGILASVGGFSKELVREAESNTSLGIVMLFGRGDLDRIFTGKARLADMMVERHTSLARYRRALFED
ncbi:MAG: hypothetical protein EON58_13880 [Alphaproteobacteria bacterium]|nr:MAG: hypothetical protein EON58_13880 [Alphaproteobacteria bacterium]